jgi:hypothetical protein
VGTRGQQYNRYRNGSVNRAQAERVRMRGKQGEPCGRCGGEFSPDTWDVPHHPLRVTCGHPPELPVAWRTDGKRYTDDELRPEHLRCNASDGATVRTHGRVRRREQIEPNSVEGTSREW